jgi:very-short-patch-repair endonuclease
MPRDPSRRLLGFARQMRVEATDAERRLWAVLRSRRLEGFKFRRQHPVAGFIVDFICLKHGLVVEADGGQHLDEEALAYDTRRAERLRDLGMHVLRFSDREVLKAPGAVAEVIYEALVPSPGTPGEG